ncbi:OprD family outer membrane porin [Sulfurimonas sp.]|uniref:OprD family outer membrane porin n=1 Tax=Sulfurimonas sp. TaxID=2022749 RepID=UPI0025D465BB|nr:OprD family outer membrane porin [Sulfurimonas sp.]MBW6488246.1 OprD family porin [Sulfurimonas sp.]
MKINTKFSTAAVVVLLAASALNADESLSKHTLKSNYQVNYNIKPKSVDNLADMFQEGILYGRLRSNTFLYDWEKETASQNSHIITAIGGSLIYRTATLGGVDFTAGLYYSKAFFDEDDDPVARLKPGRDLLSRYDFATSGDKSMTLLGQAFISYKGLSKTDIRLGRQLVETFYTKSSDTKMIPNTFEGIVIDNKTLSQTSLKIAYLTKQKQRDHTSSHSVLMYDDSDTANQSIWNANDDSAMHKGLLYTALKAAGKDTDAPLITGDIQNKSVENLTINASFYNVPELLSQAMGELNYKMKFDGFTLTPGVRYIQQFDDKAGEIGGASLRGKVASNTGYKEIDSLDSKMIAARLVGNYENFKLNLGYSQVFDEADLVTPWQGFPTAGYTRSMARLNWIANTKSYRAELMINGNQAGAYKDIVTQLSILHADADESKGEFDENFYYVGFIQNIPSFIDLQWRIRLGYTDTKKVDSDSVDGRFEVNYLF